MDLYIQSSIPMFLGQDFLGCQTIERHEETHKLARETRIYWGNEKEKKRVYNIIIKMLILS